MVDVVARLGRHANACTIGAALLMLAGFAVLSVDAGLAQQGDDPWSELTQRVRAAPIDAPDPLLDGEPVFIAARAQATQRVHDLDFAISADAVALHRHVEMYQWLEFEHVDSSGRSEWRYATDWAPTFHPSTRFREPLGHENPPFAVASEWFVSTDARIGPYRIGAGPLLDRALEQSRSARARAAPVTLGDWPRAVTALPDLLPTQAAGFIHHGDRYVRAAAANAPSVGDVRVSFSVLPRDYSMAVIGVQRGSGLEPWPMPNAEADFLAGGGTLDAATLIDDAHQADVPPSRHGRFVGLALVLFGALGLMPLALEGLRPLPGFAAAVMPVRVAIVFVGALLVALLAVGVGHAWASLPVGRLLAVAVLAVAAFVAYRWYRLRRTEGVRRPTHAAVVAPEPPEQFAAALELLARRRARLAAIRALTAHRAAAEAARAHDMAVVEARSAPAPALGGAIGRSTAPAPALQRAAEGVVAPSRAAISPPSSAGVERRRVETQATRARQLRRLLDHGVAHRVATAIPQPAVVRRCVASRGEWTLNRIARIERDAERIVGFELLRAGVVVKRGSEAEVRSVLRKSARRAPRGPEQAPEGSGRLRESA